MHPPFHESISWIISPFKFLTATIFLHAHLQVVDYKCVHYLQIFRKLYTVVVHNLQICMKEYCCCPKFRRGDNSTYTFTKRGVVYLRLQGTCPPSFRESTSWIISPSKCWTATIFLHAHLQVVHYNCVNFHKNPISRLGGVALTRYTLQMCMKEYGCCPKFGRGDNLTYTLKYVLYGEIGL
jgi:hypothetical protein